MRFQGGPRSPTRRKGRTEATALAQRRGGPLLQERIPGRWGQGSNAPVQGFSMQQCLYFLPLPQGHGSFRPISRSRFRIGWLARVNKWFSNDFWSAFQDASVGRNL